MLPVSRQSMVLPLKSNKCDRNNNNSLLNKRDRNAKKTSSKKCDRNKRNPLSNKTDKNDNKPYSKEYQKKRDKHLVKRK